MRRGCRVRDAAEEHNAAAVEKDFLSRTAERINFASVCFTAN